MRLNRPLTVLLTSLVLACPLAVNSTADAAGSIPHPDTKRGVASAKYLKTTAQWKIPAAGAAWTYNWTYRVPAATAGLDTVPMIRSASSISDAAIQTLTAGQKNGDYDYLLGFNEPDSPNQANLTPAQAANLWPKLQKTGLTLGSPVPAVPTNGWLKEFMSIAKARGLRVDFIALHFYANITDLDQALNRIRLQTDLIWRNYGKPVWITELGIIDRRSNPGSAITNWAKAVKFLRDVTAMLDARPYVDRYAWMADNVSDRRNLKWSTFYDSHGRITPLGKAYAALD